MQGPKPETVHPMEGFPQVCFIKNTVRNPNIIVGDYTYYDDPEESEDFERNVLYHYPFIGDKLIVSTRSVVVADVPAYAIVGGNPARVIRQRFDPDEIRTLEAVAWWDWPVETITRHLDLIVAGDVDALRRCAPPAAAPDSPR